MDIFIHNGIGMEAACLHGYFPELPILILGIWRIHRPGQSELFTGDTS